jgi:hypothetical protein
MSFSTRARQNSVAVPVKARVSALRLVCYDYDAEMAKRLRVHHPSDWFVKGRGKPYVPATWEGWIIFLGLLSLPFILALIEVGQ